MRAKLFDDEYTEQDVVLAEVCVTIGAIALLVSLIARCFG